MRISPSGKMPDLGCSFIGDCMHRLQVSGKVNKYQVFSESSIGDTHFSGPGVHVMTLKVAVAPWNQLNLRSLRLVRE